MVVLTDYLKDECEKIQADLATLNVLSDRQECETYLRLQGKWAMMQAFVDPEHREQMLRSLIQFDNKRNLLEHPEE
jgi:hypothetical protein